MRIAGYDLIDFDCLRLRFVNCSLIAVDCGNCIVFFLISGCYASSIPIKELLIVLKAVMLCTE